jgi:hypothetical protein
MATSPTCSGGKLPCSLPPVVSTRQMCPMPDRVIRFDLLAWTCLQCDCQGRTLGSHISTSDRVET